MPRLSKEQSRQRWAELRALWNEFDPIGVMADPAWPRNEYEAYVGPTMRLLEQDAGIDEIIKCLDAAVAGSMGLEHEDDKAKTFACRLRDWFRDKWSGTYV
ncbi:MAG: hypothetical protein HOK30_08240 [Rhodospirillaceae bacterium]|jgi:hypothetical protein|nr:hypothetical protein [Rhodospirillaceae bacterium]MBT5195253.1 hypothetical protein [Rhodospirillaceae bacterium]MBT5897033.1 hypothetical protein [Rhodospirillaceae bacterium]MBT6427635.1 hypothetical protein [Rhodospirillaceae bacterium]MBT7759256.1 hypothetical protein [Rhodospirillaceae bacterium]